MIGIIYSHCFKKCNKRWQFSLLYSYLTSVFNSLNNNIKNLIVKKTLHSLGIQVALIYSRKLGPENVPRIPNPQITC